MPRGEKLLKFLAKLMLVGFYGTVTIRFQSGKVTHVETHTRRMWEYKDLPEDELPSDICTSEGRNDGKMGTEGC